MSSKDQCYKVFSNGLIISIGTLLALATLFKSIPDICTYYSSHIHYIHVAILALTYFMWIWSWLTAAYGDPGYIKTDLQERGLLKQIQRGDIPKNLQHLKICSKCGLPMPKGSVHCDDCKTCVLRNDHHCGVIVNCVADRNFKAFVLGFFYAGLLSTVCGIYSIISCVITKENSDISIISLITGVYGLVIAVMMFCFTGIFLCTNFNETQKGQISLSDYVSSFGQHIYQYFIPLQRKSTKLAWPDVEWEFDEPLMLL